MSPRSEGPGRRALLRTASWAAPTATISIAAPAFALSQHDVSFGVNFDGGGGANGFFNSVYLNFGVAGAGQAPYTLVDDIVVVIDVIGLLTTAPDERSFTAGSDYGRLARAAYDAASRTTRITWTLPRGMVVPAAGVGTTVPDILFTFRDGASTGGGRITNKLVIRSITGGRITVWQNRSGNHAASLPIDSSVVKDYATGAVSPDGIY